MADHSAPQLPFLYLNTIFLCLYVPCSVIHYSDVYIHLNRVSFGITIKIDLLKSSRISPLSYISFVISLNLSIFKSFKFFSISYNLIWFCYFLLIILVSIDLIMDFSTMNPFLLLFFASVIMAEYSAVFLVYLFKNKYTYILLWFILMIY